MTRHCSEMAAKFVVETELMSGKRAVWLGRPGDRIPPEKQLGSKSWNTA